MQVDAGTGESDQPIDGAQPMMGLIGIVMDA